MSSLLKFRFHWRANGETHETVIEAPSYPEACYALGAEHFVQVFRGGQAIPEDFALNLQKPERVP